MDFDWSDEKNEYLKQAREVSFEMVEDAINNGIPYRIFKHPNQSKYPGQEILFIEIKRYIHAVPFINKSDGTVFLKTIYPSRKMKKYLQGEQS